MNHWLRWAASILAVGMIVSFLFFGACARVQVKTGEGIYHQVNKGENLWRICHAYRVNMATVCSLNRIADPELIWVGQRIFIPGAVAPLKIEPPAGAGGVDGYGRNAKSKGLHGAFGEAPGSKAGQVSESSRRGVVGKGAGLRFVWPVKGLVTSWFGPRNGRRHEGIDIAVAQGTPIVAAESGIVTYSGDRVSGYGNMIILRHGDGLSSVYAHNWTNRVSADQIVARGQIIGFTGKSGMAEGEHLHFEVREGVQALDPMVYLP